MKCSNCQTENATVISVNCGNALVGRCTNCHRAAAGCPLLHELRPAGGRHPDRTRRAHALAAATPAPLAEKMRAAHLAGERKVVTALFVDVVGSTALAEHMDPEDWTLIMNRAFDRLLSPVIIKDYDGTIARLLGDAILAFFGAPVAHEDDPVRAVHAALGLLADAAQIRGRRSRQKHGIEFADAHRNQHRPGGGRRGGQRPQIRVHRHGRRHQPGRPHAVGRPAHDGADLGAHLSLRRPGLRRASTWARSRSRARPSRCASTRCRSPRPSPAACAAWPGWKAPWSAATPSWQPAPAQRRRARRAGPRRRHRGRAGPRQEPPDRRMEGAAGDRPRERPAPRCDGPKATAYLTARAWPITCCSTCCAR